MPRIYNPWKPNEKEAFELFTSPNELGEALSSQNIDKKNSAIKAMMNIGHVKSSYWNWFENSDYLLQNINSIFWVGCQEKLTEDFQILKTKGELNIYLPTDEFKKHSNPTNFNKKLSKVAENNLKRWYIEEYRFLTLLQKQNLIDIEYK